jgi:NtrC-family two-component system sensor histidine kinase KinB
MKIKSKVAWALVLLFGVILGVIGVSIFYIKDLSADAKNILKDNYESLEYSKSIIEACDLVEKDSLTAFAVIEKNLQLEEQNITEDGELELSVQLRKTYERIRNRGVNDSDLAELRRLALTLQEINMKAIVRKNEITMDTAKSATTYLLIIGTILSLVAFTFIVNFPGYIANPIMALTNSIKSISNKEYEERLQFNRNDEFGELAEAFNLMAEKLDEYQHSSLANILFEKKRIETIINRMSDPVMGLDENNR